MKEIPEHFPIQVLDRNEAMTDNALGINSTKRLTYCFWKFGF
ncbi:hypothetical protein LEP1GSC096_0952 [Leptospira interrogans serovar Hebdomadis str. R499]|nr:hypothetical protein LEP1GSC096_0952 [Leptospira interrogans serovar Hebdomadis str. R499]